MPFRWKRVNRWFASPTTKSLKTFWRGLKAKNSAALPMVRGRKGHYRELFEQIMRLGYLRARVDDELVELESGYKVDRYKVHDIEAVVDRIVVRPQDADRILKSVQTALSLGKGAMAVMLLDGRQARALLPQPHVPDHRTGLSRTRTQPVQLQQSLRRLSHLQRRARWLRSTRKPSFPTPR